MKHLKLFENLTNSKFIAVLHQGGGCDYTIECGTKVINLYSNNVDDANIELSSIIEEEYNGEFALSKVTLYEIKGEHRINLDEIYSGVKNKKEIETNLENDNKEKSEYERLQKKFGSK